MHGDQSCSPAASHRQEPFLSIKFNIVERGRPGHAGAPKKYYPSIQSTDRLSMRELAERASDMSTLTTADMMAAIEALLTIIPECWRRGLTRLFVCSTKVYPEINQN